MKHALYVFSLCLLWLLMPVLEISVVSAVELDRNSTVSSTGPTANVHAVLQGTKISISYQDTPFDEVINDLRRSLSINIFVNWPALETVGIDRDEPVNIHLNRVSAQRALQLILNYISAGKERTANTEL